MQVVPEYGMRIWLFASSVAVPETNTGHDGEFGTAPVAVADQVAAVAVVSVAVAEPVTFTLPMHVALKVPDPEVPVNCVTAQLKSTHESLSEPDAPGIDCVVAHVPPSAVDAAGVVVVVVALGFVRLLRMSQAQPAADAVRRTATSIARRMVSPQNSDAGATAPL